MVCHIKQLSISRISRTFAKCRLVTIPVVSSMLLSICSTSVAHATQGLTVTGVVLVADVIPGQALDHAITVNIGDEDSARDISIVVAGMGQAPDGAYIALDQSLDDSSTSACSFVTLDGASFSLKPGETRDVTATILVPQTVGQGGKYALITIQTRGSGGATVGVSSAVNIPVYLTVANSRLEHTGNIVDVVVNEPTTGKPLDITTRFQNTGNHHFKVQSELTILAPDDAILGIIHLSPAGPSIIPGMTRSLKATFIPEGQLHVGHYSVVSKVMSEDGDAIDEVEGVFEVREDYTPPPLPAEVTLIPSSSGLLASGDGRVSVSFQKGAVTSEAHIGLRNCPPEQLHAPTDGMKFATESFRMEGLNGLLANPATVQVKYTESDLELAGGDASHLALARWDETSDKWITLKTIVDQRTTTLTAVSSRLGTWAVMVKASRPAAVPWTQIVLIVGLAVCLGIILIASKRRKAH